MNKHENIQREVETTLQSLDGISRAEANPFLFTRIKARMQRQSAWERVTSFISRPVIAIAALVLVMAINGWAVFGTDENTATQTNESIAASDIADEYNLFANTNYELENNNTNE
jgi:hypothetical protein